MPLDLAPNPVATEASEGSSWPRVLLLVCRPEAPPLQPAGRRGQVLAQAGLMRGQIGTGGTGRVRAAQLSTRTRECPGTPTRMDAGLARAAGASPVLT